MIAFLFFLGRKDLKSAIALALFYAEKTKEARCFMSISPNRHSISGPQARNVIGFRDIRNQQRDRAAFYLKS